MRLKTIETLDRRPFKHFCATIGELPTSFIDSMSYYELLAWFCQYLEKTVIPTINENAEAVKELQDLFVELKEYVDNYFETLDIQEIVDNKLDEMAESGQLAEIITQYLNLGVVFGFYTISEMSEATNLQNGCIARVIGNNTADEGDGAYYTIRNRLDTDEPDGYNLVAIGETLVGKRIYGENERKLSTLPVDEKSKVMLFSFFDGGDSNKINFFISEDAVNLKKLNVNTTVNGRDPSLLYKNGKFYMATTGYSTDYDFTVRVSEDLNDWQEYHVDLGLYNAEFPYRWAPEWFEDDNGKLYVILSVQYANTQGWGDFKPYIAECTDLDTLTFDSAQLMTLNGSTNDNHIDGSIVKHDGVYHLFIKSDQQDDICIEHYTSTNDLTTWTRVNVDPCRFGTATEGPTTFKYDNQIYVMCDKYKTRPQSKAYQLISKTNNLTDYTNPVELAFPEISLSHGSCVVIEKKIINSLLTNGNTEIVEKNPELNIINQPKNFHIVASQLTNNDQSSGVRLGKYLHLFDVSAQGHWRTNYVEFKISTVTSPDIDASYTLSIMTQGGTISRIRLQEIDCEMRGADMPASASGKMFAVKDATNPMLVHVYLDIETAVPQRNTPINLTILNSQLWIANIIKFADKFTNTMDTSSGMIATANGSYRSRNVTLNNATRTKARIVFATYNGAISVEGNTNNVDDAHRLSGKLETRNHDGLIRYINLNPNLNSAGQAITFTKEAYSNGEYTILIENIPTSSCMQISIPNSDKSYIKDVTYPT